MLSCVCFCHPTPALPVPVLTAWPQVASTSADYQPDERDPEVELVLTENDYTLKMWPYKFKAVSTASWKDIPAPWQRCRCMMGHGEAPRSLGSGAVCCPHPHKPGATALAKQCMALEPPAWGVLDVHVW